MIIRLLNLNELRPLSKEILSLTQKIKEDLVAHNCIHTPLLIDNESKVIVDGNHRYFALKSLKANKVPCLCVNYVKNNVVSVYSLRRNLVVSKKNIIKNALDKKLLAPRSIKHIIKIKIEKKPYSLKSLL